MAKKSTSTKLEKDGERMIPEYDRHTIAYGDHIARYRAITPLIKDRIVLDIACGSGYGSQMMAEHAQQVYGIDINEPTVKYAREHFNGSNITYKVGDAIKIPLQDSSVDVVISFETIEHIKQSSKFLSEVKRVLKPGGVFVVSTPNDDEFPTGNEFHVHEYEYGEITNLLKKHFANVQTYFQAIWLFSGFGQKHQMLDDWRGVIPVINDAPIKPKSALFFILVCSDDEITQSLETNGVMSEHWSPKKLQVQNDKTEKYIKKTVRHYEGIIEGKDKYIAELVENQNKYKAKYEAIINSRSWRLTQPLRKAHRFRRKDS